MTQDKRLVSLFDFEDCLKGREREREKEDILQQKRNKYNLD
jgi:hypothetical protein